MINLSKLLMAFILKVIVVLLFMAPAENHAQKRSTSVNVDNGKTTISIKNGKKNSFSLEYEGDITISDDDKDIVGVSSGGYVEIKKSAFGSRRRIFIEPGSNGNLIKKYYIGSSEENFATEGKRWLAEILPEILRSSVLGAEKRVDRFYKKGGTYAVLQEVEHIDSDFVKSRYLKLLLDKNPKNSDLNSILKVVGSDINSDHHRATILKHNSKAFLATDATTTAYIAATAKINSDHHKAEVLKTSIRNGAISESQLKSLFAITKNINSDHHKASVLKEVMNNRSLNSNNINLLIDTSRNINSDHHKASVLKAALANDNLSESSYAKLLESINGINSDHHSSSIISSLLNKKLGSESLSNLLQLADRNLSSDHHMSQVLKKVIEKQSLQNGNLNVLLTTLKGMSSDHNKSDIFKKLSNKSFNGSQLSAILAATKSMSSDHSQAQSLIAFSKAVRGEGDSVKEAYRDACASISSELYFGRALRAIQ